jgi:hypothetical protein
MNMLQLLKKEPPYGNDVVLYLMYQLLKAIKFVPSADLVLLNLNVRLNRRVPYNTAY